MLLSYSLKVFKRLRQNSDRSEILSKSESIELFIYWLSGSTKRKIMKSKNLQQFLFFVIFLLTVFSSKAQEDTLFNKFSYHSVSISPLGFFYSELESYNDNSIFAGPAFSGQVNFNYGKNLFGISGTIGTNVDIIWSDGVDDWFYGFDVLYGREFKFSKRLYLDAFGGIGILNKRFDESVRENGIEGATVFSVPLKVKLKPMVSERFAIGFQLQTLISSEKPLFTAGLLLQFHRNAKF